MAASNQVPRYEKWIEVDATQQRIHVIGKGDYKRNPELEEFFSRVFGTPVAAVYQHALKSDAKILPGAGLEMYNESLFIIKQDGVVVMLAAFAEGLISTSTDVVF
jgi:hypothetical protein